MAKRRAGGTFIQRSRQKSSAEKATYHELEGAGRSRVRREFFGVNAEDEAAIVKRIETHVDRAIQG